MKEAKARRLARWILALILIELGAGLVFDFLASAEGGSGTSWGDLGFLAGIGLFPILGYLLASRRPDNSLGWIMLAIGVVGFEPSSGYGEYALTAGLPGGSWAAGAMAWSWIPVIGLSGIWMLLLFPDGHLPSARWKWFAWTIAIGMVVGSLAILLGPGTLEDIGIPNVRNPYAVESLKPVLDVALVSLATIPIGILGAALSLVFRYRRGDSTERLQIRWLASAAIVVATVYAITMVVSIVGSTGGWGEGDTGLIGVLQTISILLFVLLPISIGIAILKHNLYDIDVVINKALVYGGLAAFITGVYVLIVVGVGAVTGSASNTILSALAAALVALAFQPVRRRAQHLANRLVYGKRATPYEVLSQLSDQLAETYSLEEVLPRTAKLIVESTGVDRAEILLGSGKNRHAVASWPERNDASQDGQSVFPVRHQGEEMGAIAVTTPPNDPLTPTQVKLIENLSSQAGLVLRNVALIDDLRASRQRLVAAQDEERRKIERNLHDGAQQQLVALSVKIRLLQGMIEKEPGKATSLAGDAATELTGALEELRSLARGIYPPLLADKGLATALEAQARKAAVAVTVESDGVGRLPQESEAAVYFCCLEALQNIAKYANASQATVSLSMDKGDLVFRVRDDGMGFDPKTRAKGAGLQNMTDRIDAVGGILRIQSVPGGGTTITGKIPVPSETRP